MTETLLYKAVNPDLTSRNGLCWELGSTVTHPTSTEMVRDAPATYLSLSTEPAETLIGRGWPARLLRVEPMGEVISSDTCPHKRCCLSARVVDEIDSWRVFGPNGEAVVALIERVSLITGDEAKRLLAAWDAVGNAAWLTAWNAVRNAAWDAAWPAAWPAARDAVWDTAWNAAWAAAWDAAGAAARNAAGAAAGALVIRDLISTEQFETLTGPWVSVVGPFDALADEDGKR